MGWGPIPGRMRWLGPFVVLVTIGCERITPEADSVAPPNVIIVTIDTLRADHLGSYGSEAGLTPHLDEFARSALVFREAVAPMATTFPSHGSLFTGLYPRTHGVRWNGDRLGAMHETLAERLRDAGYATGAFVSYKSMVHRGGLGQGFQRRSPDRLPEDVSPVRPGPRTVQLAIRWLEQAPSPFFLWVHLFEPHLPYPLTDYAARRVGSYEGPLADGASVEEVMSLRGTWAGSPEATRFLRTLYAGRVRDADASFGRLLDALGRGHLLERSLLIVASDHGQLLGEHGEVGHGPTFYEPALRVPLLVRGPGLATGGVDERVGLVDVTPTVLDWLGLDVPGDLEGRSLVAAFRGEPLSPSRYFAEARSRPRDAAEDEGRWQASSGVAVWEGDLKLVQTPIGTSLFDLAADPTEAHPQGGERSPSLGQAASEYRPAAPIGAPSLQRHTVEELRALGYLRD